ncbi:hypothetical protein DENSPDRAFT_834019 [Dentipellis sp. KUC8613]|nr:hypothetical protein DENSPDRAFT_834019 [Dentipellis sp. KUC8613]
MDRSQHLTGSQLQSQYISRKTLAIKRGDSETLTREDVQYDLLYYIFTDPTLAFTDETPGKPPTKVNFCDLYVNALYNSTKCSKIMRDKMTDTPAFAIEFAKISLLTNVGRINTTMAFFPEMKTALRSYHPVPSLQKTDGNVQDAPRIKNCLKAALLPGEQKSPPPSTPADIISRVRAGTVPPTSIVNLLFVLTNYSTSLAPIHFDPPVEFVDIFLPINISSVARAKAFLWMVFHYHESPDLPNPFSDDYARSHPGKVPWLLRLSPEEQRRENVDPPEEIEWGKKMAGQRSMFLQDLVSGNNPERRQKEPVASSSTQVEDTSTRARRPRHYYTHESQKHATFHHYIPTEKVKAKQSENPPPAPVVTTNTNSHVGGRVRGREREHERPQEREREPPAPAPRSRSMFQQAWQRVQTMDPLVDSDEEGLDEHARAEYQGRLRVLHSIWPQGPASQHGHLLR